jgi:acetolactate synthase-1/2/3 large subunit
LAEAYGIHAIRVTSPSEVEDAIQTALAYKNGPILAEFVVAMEENVYPMIPAAQTVNEIIDNPEPVKESAEQSDASHKIMIHAKG